VHDCAAKTVVQYRSAITQRAIDATQAGFLASQPILEFKR
jgi:hypothetical protein